MGPLSSRRVVIIAGLDAAQGISTGYTVGVISFP
jgi:hypothetical protein